MINSSSTTSSGISMDSIISQLMRSINLVIEEKRHVVEYFENQPGDTVKRTKTITDIDRKTIKNQTEKFDQKSGKITIQNENRSDSAMIKKNSSENIMEKIDSRPVQGFEWVWIGIVFIIGILIIFIFKKYKLI